jgi:hypothetical protein
MTDIDIVEDAEDEINMFLEGLDPLAKLDMDLKDASRMLCQREVRYLVSLYYKCQEYRIATSNQNRALTKLQEPNQLILWALGNFKTLEKNIAMVMDKYTMTTLAGRWQRSITGIGPVIAAGLIGYLEIEKAPTAGQFWRYAGLDPSVEWIGKERAAKLVTEVVGSGRVKITPEHVAKCALRVNRNFDNVLRQATEEGGKLTRASLQGALAKRPWNADLKTLCWKMGESFVKVKNRDSDYYGKVYAQRKEQEAKWNEQGKYAEQAKAKLEKYNITAQPTRGIYESGKLPPAHLHERAKRYAVKLYLSHLHYVLHVEKIGYLPPPPRPYVIEHMGHTHIIPVPDPLGILPEAPEKAA